MRNGIFVTGGSGFVGRPLLAALHHTGRPVTTLTRSDTLRDTGDGITVVQGDLLRPETYRAALRSCDVVIHLAATTGRASADEHMRVNARGTEVLVNECRDAGVSKILFVSSIATTFQDITGYHYAKAKRRAEETVSRYNASSQDLTWRVPGVSGDNFLVRTGYPYIVCLDETAPSSWP